MLLKCREIMEGPGPSEVVVEIIVKGGTEEVMLQASSLRGSALEVGSILGVREG